MISTLTYNGVTIKNCWLKEFNQREIRDESDTDALHHLFSVRVQGTVHASDPTIHGISPYKSGDVPSSHALLRKKLMEMRKNFAFKIGDKTLLAALPYPAQTAPRLSGYDLANGPRPTDFKIVRIVGNQILEVEFAIDVALLECESERNATGVLSNRWGVLDSIDQNFYTTRTYRGRLRVASTNLNPHSFRRWVVPPLQKGFLRKKINCTSTPDGLCLDYEIMDQQTSNAPPPPATEWSGRHTVRTDRAIAMYNSVDVTLTGPEGVKKVDLIGLAAMVVKDRLNYQISDNVGSVVEEISISDMLHSNTVTMSMTVKKAEKVMDIATLDATRIGTDMEIEGYDRLKGLVPKVYGTTTTVGLFTCFLQSPCSPEHSIPSSTDTSTGDRQTSEEGGEGTEIFTFEGPSSPLQEAESPYSEGHKSAIYTFYELDTEFEIDDGTLSLPIANARSASGDNVPTSKMIRLHAPISKMKIKVAAERVGDKPKMPKKGNFTDDNGIEYWLKKSKVIVAAPELTADGVSKMYSITGQYEYGMSRPLGDREQFSAGSLPWDRGTESDELISNADLVQDGIL